MTVERSNTSRIPVTILAGFLGAGKTTLLLSLLKQTTDQKIAVIVNEFGEVGIDGSLLRDVTDSVVELPGGALCCAASGDISQALAKLWDLSMHIDRVVIETTGLADPLPLMKTFYHRPTLEKTYVLDGVVTVVDAVHAMERLLNDEWRRQVELASLVVVSKTDLVGGMIPEEIETHLQALNPCAERVTDGLALLNHSAQEMLASTVPDAPVHHDHSSGVTSVYLKVTTPLSLEKVSRFIGEYLVLNGDRLWRYKGIFSIDGREERFVFQGMGFSFEHVPDRPWEADEIRESVLVLIGENIKKEEFQDAFESCRA